jgi:hypothetical protein
LFQDEHVVIEELLQLLVGVIDAELFKAVLIKDFEAGNIKNSDEVRIISTSPSLVQLAIDAIDEVAEAAFVDTLSKSIDGKVDLFWCLDRPALTRG